MLVQDAKPGDVIEIESSTGVRRYKIAKRSSASWIYGFIQSDDPKIDGQRRGINSRLPCKLVEEAK